VIATLECLGHFAVRVERAFGQAMVNKKALSTRPSTS
jgi:hypothetical protein